MKRFNLFLALATLWLCATRPAGAAPADDSPESASFPVDVRIDARHPKGKVQPIWRFFGADEPNYAAMPDGAKLLGELGDLDPDAVWFRTHNLLNSGDGTPALKWGSTGVYREDSMGRPIYDWTILDQIFDAYRRHHVRPYVEIGFMPEALSTKPEPYRHHWTPQLPYNEIFTGWAYPPQDYQQWGELVRQWTAHCVERYGKSQVEQWFWETWNEPNIGYWRGTPQEFLKLHDFAIQGVRQALPSARVGGPDVAGSGGKFLRNFLDHCLTGTNFATRGTGTPLDFVSFHAKGAPRFVNDHVRMGIANELRTADDGFAIIASYPQLKGVPVVIGECDPEGCAACQGPQLAYRNGTMYSSYTAASFARLPQLAARRGVNLLGALTWAFEFEGQPYFAGFRSLASRGIDKPVLNVFRMFAKLKGAELPVTSDGEAPLDEILRSGVRGKPDVSAVAALAPDRLAILAWHYHDDDLAGPDADLRLRIDNLPPRAGDLRLRQFRIDATHSNAYALWKSLGSPQNPTPEQYARLEKAGHLQTASEPVILTDEGSTIHLQLRLPRQAVALLTVEWGS